MAESQYKVPENDAFLMKLSIFLATAVSFVMAVFTFMRDWTADMMTLHLRLGGKLFIIFFLTAFSASSFYYFFPNKFTHWLRYHRKYFGLGAVVIMFWHFLVIALKVSVDWGFAVKELTPGEVIPSIIGLFFLGGMGITSSAKMHARLGHEKWQRLHTYGGNLFLANLWFGTIDGFEPWDIPLFLAATTVIIMKAARELDLKLKRDKLPLRRVMTPLIAGYFVCAVIVQYSIPTYEEDQAVIAADNPIPTLARRNVFDDKNIFPAQEYLPLQPGNSWTYRVSHEKAQPVEVSYDVRRSGKVTRLPRFRLHTSDDRYAELVQDNYGIRVLSDNRGDYNWFFTPPGIQLPHMHLGQRVTFPLNIRQQALSQPDAVDLKGSVAFELAAVEPVAVPAGTYPDCLRVEYTQRIDYPGGSFDVIRGTAWYARMTGKVKDQRKIARYQAATGRQSESEETMELTASVVGK
ncbi:MAG: ferric reductase-like transmembrane domain-containing protein [Candidatus Omnitrophica bacterium]|nr:ferric reductase-like transmembrane domain-containing protein [Candidatus Omnitrophota bacterium]